MAQGPSTSSATNSGDELLYTLGILPRGPSGSSFMYNPLRVGSPMQQSYGWVNVKNGPAVFVVARPGRVIRDEQDAIDEGMATKTRELQGKTPVNLTRRPLTIRTGHKSLNEEIPFSKGVDVRGLGRFTINAADISASSRANLVVHGMSLNSLSLGRFGGTFEGGPDIRRFSAPNAAFSIRGGKQPTIHDPAGSFMIGGYSFGVLAKSAAEQTEWRFDPTHKLHGYTHPVAASLIHHVSLGTPQAVRTSLARNAAEVGSGPFHGHARRRNEHEHEIRIQHPVPHYA